jgi:solute carrier family 66 (lysosomal lysine-arginine transporter), member 1
MALMRVAAWLGDAPTNCPNLGALFTRLAPTAIILPCYFVLADVVLILQCIYYNNLNKRRAAAQLQEEVAEASEDSPLLRRSSSLRSRDAEEPSKLPAEDDAVATGTTNAWVNNTLSLLAVYGVGCAAWFISYKAGAWDTKEPAPDAPEEVENPLEIAGLTLGYISAVCYLWYAALSSLSASLPPLILTCLSARIPQIIKNYKEKSCEGTSILTHVATFSCTSCLVLTFIPGLALLFFMLSLTGNLTYGTSLVAYSQERKYLLNALPFLLGSLGTIVEDCIIFVQFRLYADGKRSRVA